LLFDVQPDLQVAVILLDPRDRRPHRRLWPFKPLHIYVRAADQGARNSIPFIREAGMYQDAAQNTRIKAKGPRRIDHPQMVRDGPVSFSSYRSRLAAPGPQTGQIL
jgi:hypothetical protein